MSLGTRLCVTQSYVRSAFGCIHVGAVVVDPYSLAMDSHWFHAFCQEAGSKAVTVQCG